MIIMIFHGLICIFIGPKLKLESCLLCIAEHIYAQRAVFFFVEMFSYKDVDVKIIHQNLRCLNLNKVFKAWKEQNSEENTITRLKSILYEASENNNLRQYTIDALINAITGIFGSY